MKTIAIVEDDEEICSQLAGFLSNNGYDCIVIKAFERVPQQIAASGADMVLLDITLPGADGGNILRKLREISNIPSLW